MGVDVSTPALALAIARLGGIGHLSDAMLPTMMDRHFGTSYVREQRARSRVIEQPETAPEVFDLSALRAATFRYVRDAMDRKHGEGGIFLNVMEKLTMGNPR